MSKFIMLIGLPGAGKSTMANTYTRTFSASLLSSDGIRKELYGDETIQDDPDRVFELMRKRTISLLQSGTNVVYDATNLHRKHRKHLLSNLPSDCRKIAVVVWAKVEECIARDNARERTVGTQVIEKMLRGFQPPYFDEGWDEIRLEYTSGKYTANDYIDWIDCPHDNPHHPNTVAEHTHKVVNCVYPVCAENEAPNAAHLLHIVAFLHDIGKKHTKSFVNSKGETTDTAHYYDHHNVGSYYTLGYEPIQGLSVRNRLLVAWLVNAHMEPFFNSRYYRGLDGKEKQMLDLFHLCDVRGA